MHCGDPRRVRTSRVGRCTGFVQWAQFGVLAPWHRRFPCASYLETNCSHVFAPGDDERPAGGLSFVNQSRLAATP